jgi:hemerythrin-like domain-containing protein
MATSFERQVNRALDDEHRENLDLLNRVGLAFARAQPNDAAAAALAAGLARHARGELPRHFGFEERDLFPRLVEAGEGDIVGLLQEEHDAIRAVVAELGPLADAAVAGPLDGAGWGALRRTVLELAERLTSHIDKETLALLPILEAALDEDTDRELAFAYASA